MIGGVIFFRLNVKHKIGLGIAYAQHNKLQTRLFTDHRTRDVAYFDGLFFHLELLV